MAIYHLTCKIKNCDVVGAAAYRAGCVLYNKFNQKRHDFRKKTEVRDLGIFLCGHAPEEYSDRATLWNAVEEDARKTGKDYRGRNGKCAKAREYEVAIPNEFDFETAKEVVTQFAKSLALDGMIVDTNIHWKEKSEKDEETGEISTIINHHAHLLCTTRPIGLDHKWQNKSKKVYKLNEDGLKIPVIDKAKIADYEKERKEVLEKKLKKEEEKETLYNLMLKYQKKDERNRKQWKSYKEREKRWDEKNYLLNVRRKWEDLCNEQLDDKNKITCKSHETIQAEKERNLTEKKGRSRVDKLRIKREYDVVMIYRNYLPTIHEGWQAREMERNGRISHRCEYNRYVKENNDLIIALVKMIMEFVFDMLNQIWAGVDFFFVPDIKPTTIKENKTAETKAKRPEIKEIENTVNKSVEKAIEEKEEKKYEDFTKLEKLEHIKSLDNLDEKIKLFDDIFPNDMVMNNIKNTSKDASDFARNLKINTLIENKIYLQKELIKIDKRPQPENKKNENTLKL